MPYNLAEAGAAIGRSKSSVLRAIRRGAISASRDEVTGGWAIDPAELHRAFPPVASGAAERPNGTARNGTGTGETAEIRELRARLGDAQDQITDLRRRLDVEAEERRRLTALLTDGRSTSAATPEVPTGWRRLLRTLGHAR